MKRLLFAMLLMIASATAAVTSTYNGTYLTSNATQTEDGMFRYSYTIQPSDVSQNDVSHFEVFYCDDIMILDPDANVRFKAVLTDLGFKWDSLKGYKSGDIIFTFVSAHIPELGDVEIKAGTSLFYDKALVPSCQTIPETSSLALLGCGALLLFRRKR